MQMNSQFYGREQLPPQHQQMYGQGMSPHNSEMRPYQQMPIGSHPAAGLQQRVQCINIYFQHDNIIQIAI
jgi:ribosome modulation factor